MVGTRCAGDALRSKAMAYLEKGRPNWDAPHTEETVRWMEELIENEGGNRRVLVSTMWLHDIGYSGLFDGQPASFDNVMGDVRSNHMRQGADLARKILTELGYPLNEIDRISQLVSIHDTLEKLESPYEILVMEADTLGMLSGNLKQSPGQSDFSRDDHTRFLAHVRNDRKPRFGTESGRRYLEDLLPRVEQVRL